MTQSKLFFNRLMIVAACLVLLTTAGVAQEKTKLKFTLDWKLQSIHAWYYWAQDKGYFAAENLDVTIDQGEGSAATVTRILSGAYDAGFGDINAIIDAAAKRPGEAPVMVYMIYSKAPFAVLAKADGPIQSVKDLAGHKLGSPAGGAALKLLPLLAKTNGVDPAKIEITQVAPALQEQMLLQKQVDAVAVFTVTSYMNLAALKLDPDKDFRWLYYTDAGLDLYSNGVMVSAKLAKDKPDVVKGLLRAINRAIKETVADPDAAVALLMSKEPLLNKSLERKRLAYVYKTFMATPEVQDLGLGDISDARLGNAIKTIAESYDLPRVPALKEVFDRSFLPPKADRVAPAPVP